MHKHQSSQTGNGGKGGRRNLRDCLGQSGNTGFSCRQGFGLIAETVAENDGVINGEG